MKNLFLLFAAGCLALLVSCNPGKNPTKEPKSDRCCSALSKEVKAESVKTDDETVEEIQIESFDDEDTTLNQPAVVPEVIKDDFSVNLDEECLDLSKKEEEIIDIIPDSLELTQSDEIESVEVEQESKETETEPSAE